MLRALAVRQLRVHGILGHPVRIVGTASYLPVFKALVPERDLFLQPYEDRLWSSLFTPSPRPAPDLCAALQGTRTAVVWLPRDPKGVRKLRHCGVADVRWADPRSAATGEHQLRTLLRVVGAGKAVPARLTTPQKLLEMLCQSRRILVHPGAGSPRKRLRALFYERVSSSLREAGWQVKWLLGPAEFEDAELQNTSRRFETLRCQDTEELIGHLRRFPVVFGNDSGVEHLAAALGAATVSLFLSTEPKRWHPVSPLALTVDLRRRPPQVRAFRGLFEVQLDAEHLRCFNEVLRTALVAVASRT